MSQIPRRTTLYMTQTPKVRKTPTVTPAASQPMMMAKRQDETPVKTIDMDAPILIEDGDFGDSLMNHDLIQVLNSAEEKNGLKISNNGSSVDEGVVVATPPPPQPPTNGSGKAKESSKRSKSKKTASEGVQESPSIGAGGDDNQSCSTASIRSSVDSTAPVEMESLLIPDDDELVSPKSVSSYDSPRPNKTPGKVVRLAKGLRVSPFRKASDQQLDNVSTIVNLSTVSEQSVENNLDSPAPAAAKNGDAEDQETVDKAGEGETEDSNSGVSDATSTGGGRRISARRTYATNRPLREMSFRNATREAYKRTGGEEEEAAVNDSVNATVGSELGFNMDDLPETPAAGVKRRRDSSDAEGDEEPQPKKSLFQTYCVVM